MSFLVFGLFAVLMARGAIAETSITPTNYTLELLLDTSSDTFTGRLIIDAKVTPGQGGAVNFALHNNGLNISTINVYQAGGSNLYSSSVYFSADQKTQISLNRGLQSGLPVQVVVAYSGTVSSTPTGLYSYVDNGKKYYMTNFYPIYARKVFPCIDEPGTAATISLSLLLSQNQAGKLIGSTPIVTQVDKANNLRLYQFATTPAIAPYSLFFTLGEWDDRAYSLPRTAGNLKLWLSPRVASNTNLLDPGFMNVFDKNSRLYQLVNFTNKIDIFVSPVMSEDTYSGLGAVVLKQDIAVNNALQTTTEMYVQNFVKIASAIYKVFFGTLSRPENWRDSWLSSSIPLYLAYSEMDDIKAELYGSSDESLVPGLEEEVLQMSWPADSPFPYPLNSPSKPSAIISHVNSPAMKKGFYAIKTLETVTPPEKVKSSLLIYFLSTLNGTMETQKFATFLNTTFNAKIIGGSVRDILLPIVSYSGIPLISMSRDQQTIYIQKDSFMQKGRDPPSNVVSKLYDVSSWLLPITAITSFNPDQSKVSVYYYPSQSNRPIDLTGPYPTDGWALLNVNGTGIIRINYDVQSLNNFRSRAMSAFSPVTRAKLISDSFAASEAKPGQNSRPQSWEATLNFLEVLNEENELAPWKAALTGFKRMWSWIYFTGTANNVNSTGQINLATDFTSYVKQRLHKVYQKLGPIGVNEDPKDPLRREIVNAMCEYGSNECVQNLSAQYSDWINKVSTPSPNLFSVVACNGIRGITSGQEWLKHYQKFVNSGEWISADIWKATFSFLACPDSDKNEYSEPINWYLKTVLMDTQANRFPINHVKPAVLAIIDRPQHLDQTLNFVLTNQAALNVSIDIQAEIITEIGKLLSSPTQVAQLSSFIKANRTLDPVLGSAINASIASAESKAAWILSVQKDIQKGLQGGTPPITTTSTTSTTTTPSSTPSTITTSTTNRPPTTKGASTFGLSLLGLALSWAFLSIAH